MERRLFCDYFENYQRYFGKTREQWEGWLGENKDETVIIDEVFKNLAKVRYANY